MLTIGGTMFFDAATSAGGRELWKTDGSSAGTAQVKDISPGPQDSWPSYLANFNNTLLFSAQTPSAGTELWRSDGTGGRNGLGQGYQLRPVRLQSIEHHPFRRLGLLQRHGRYPGAWNSGRPRGTAPTPSR